MSDHIVIRRHPHNSRIRVTDVGGLRYYVHRTTLKTYVLATCWPYGLDDMVKVGGEYHHRTLADLKVAIAQTIGGPR